MDMRKPRAIGKSPKEKGERRGKEENLQITEGEEPGRTHFSVSKRKVGKRGVLKGGPAVRPNPVAAEKG